MMLHNGQLQYKPIGISYGYNDLIVNHNNTNYVKPLVNDIVYVSKNVFPSNVNDNLKKVFGDEIRLSNFHSNNFIQRNTMQGNSVIYEFNLDTDLKKQIFNFVVELIKSHQISDIQIIDDKTLKINKR